MNKEDQRDSRFGDKGFGFYLKIGITLATLYGGYLIFRTTVSMQITQTALDVVDLRMRMTALDKTVQDRDSNYSTSIARMNEKMSSIDRRMERMEDLLERALFNAPSRLKDRK